MPVLVMIMNKVAQYNFLLVAHKGIKGEKTGRDNTNYAPDIELNKSVRFHT